MEDMSLKFYSPVVTGIPTIPQHNQAKNCEKEKSEQVDFKDVLSESIRNISDVNFSKHAVKRAIEHNIELSDENLGRLNEGVKIASSKNLEEPLILVDGTAFLVNIPNNTVITAMDSGKTKVNVFTNIDGTVII